MPKMHVLEMFVSDLLLFFAGSFRVLSGICGLGNLRSGCGGT